MIDRRDVPETVASTDGVTLQVYDLGGSGPPLLLCHATGFCGPVWRPMANSLSAHFQCIALDFRAHGRSTAPAGRPLVWQGFADDVIAVIDALGAGEPMAAIGHSMGGAALALAEVRRPGTLACAWTFEPILFPRRFADDRPVPSEISEGARRRRSSFASRQEAYDRFSSRPPLSVLDDRALRAYVEHGFAGEEDGTVTLRCRPEREAEVYEHHDSGARSIVGALTIPFAMAAGGDGGRPAEEVLAAGAEFPHLQVLRYGDLTHFGPLQDPDRIAADAAAWLLARCRDGSPGDPAPPGR